MLWNKLPLPLKTTEEDKEDATASIATANQISVDAAARRSFIRTGWHLNWKKINRKQHWRQLATRPWSGSSVAPPTTIRKPQAVPTDSTGSQIWLVRF